MEIKRINSNKSNPLEITCEFHPSSSRNNGFNKLNFLKNQIQPLINFAQNKYINDSITNMLQNKSLEKYFLAHDKNIITQKTLSSNSIIDNSDSFPYKNNLLEVDTFQNKHSPKNKSLKGKLKNNSSTAIYNDNLNLNYWDKMFKEINLNENQKNFIAQNKTSTLFNNSMLKNEQIFSEKKKQNIAKLKYKILDEEKKNYKSTPGIDKGSMKIINKKFKNKKPLYERYEEVKNEKNTKILNKKKECIRNNSARNLSSKFYNDRILNNEMETFDDRITNINSFTKENNFDAWLRSNEQWQVKKNQKFLNLKKSLDEEKLKLEESTYTPRIDKISDIIAVTKNFNEYPGMETYEKLYRMKEVKIHHHKMLLEKNKPSFNPVINNYIPKYFNSNQKRKKI